MPPELSSQVMAMSVTVSAENIRMSIRRDEFESADLLSGFHMVQIYLLPADTLDTRLRRARFRAALLRELRAAGISSYWYIDFEEAVPVTTHPPRPYRLRLATAFREIAAVANGPDVLEMLTDDDTRDALQALVDSCIRRASDSDWEE